MLSSQETAVCNGCPKRNACTLEKHLYIAHDAQREYELVRSESRSGFNLSEQEKGLLDDILSPLLKNGQSIHHVMANNADRIPRCSKTIYRYVDGGVLGARNIDLPRKVRFRPRKAISVPLKVDKACRVGRTYEDFKIDRMMNHINSYSRPDLGNKPPYALMEFYYGKTPLEKFRFSVIAPNDIVLKPSLLKRHD